MQSFAIVLQNVTKRFKDTEVLRNITVSFAEGKIHGIVGRNGSGKTVLFKCICGLMHPDKGAIIVQGKKVGLDVDIPKGVGAIIESPGFLPTFSGRKNLKFLADINKVVDEERIKECMSIVGLDYNCKKHVGKYSLGMRQRLGIAQAIMEKPNVLILDEPMNGLDNSGVKEMRDLLLKINSEGVTILLASHNKDDIQALCDTVLEMDHGQIIAIQTTPAD